MSTLTLNLDDQLAHRLAAAAARHQQALPDWAVEQLTRLAGATGESAEDTPARERMHAAVTALTGIWKDRGTTEELMNLTRGED